MIDAGELRDYLNLAFTPQLGAISFLKLLKAFGSAQAAYNLPFEAIRPYLEKPNLVSPYWHQNDIEKNYVSPALKWQEQDNCCLLTLLDTDYPLELTHVYPPPPVLFLRGHKHLLKSPKIAMVGSRKATPQGLQIATETAKIISENNMTIVSGLATGIDTASHLGALAGIGSTIAIIGTGIDLVYPKTNHELAHKITSEGLIISEFPLGTKAYANNFPIRNRLIAGLSLATVVVEASLQSGSLITARLASELGKETMAFPSSIYNTQAKGNHKLIKEGAKLVESAYEILEDFTKSVYNDKKDSINKTDSILSEVSQLILNAMGNELIHPDEITNRTQLNLQVVHENLLQLELDGLIKISSGGRFQRIIF